MIQLKINSTVLPFLFLFCCSSVLLLSCHFDIWGFWFLLWNTLLSYSTFQTSRTYFTKLAINYPNCSSCEQSFNCSWKWRKKRIRTATMTTSPAFEQSIQSTTLISRRLVSREAQRCLDNILTICICCPCLNFFQQSRVWMWRIL